MPEYLCGGKGTPLHMVVVDAVDCGPYRRVIQGNIILRLLLGSLITWFQAISRLLKLRTVQTRKLVVPPPLR
jgi:hypothetical protein